MRYRKNVSSIKLRQELSSLSQGRRMKTDETAHDRPGEALNQTIAKLKERNKELNCLYAVSRIVQRQHHSLEEILQQVVDILPLAWQDPEHTCARIVFENQAFKSNSFSKTPCEE